jgi:hypothetical protein
MYIYIYIYINTCRAFAGTLGDNKDKKVAAAAGAGYVKRQHTSVYVGIRQNSSAYVSIPGAGHVKRQHTSAYIRIRGHT